MKLDEALGPQEEPLVDDNGHGGDRLGLDALGYSQATEVQEAVVPLALAGGDLQVSAETGSGKTLAYLVRTALRRLDEFTSKLLCLPPGRPHPEVTAYVSTMEEQFFTAMDDDLNVSLAMAAIYNFIKKTNPILQVNHLDRDQKDYILEKLNRLNQVLKIFKLQGCPLEPEIDALIQLREKARVEKDWQTADSARNELAERGIAGTRVLQGLLALSSKHRIEQIEQACDVALRHGEFRLRTIRRLIDRQVPVQQLMPFLEEHEMIRPLSNYDAYVHDCVQGNL